VRASVDLRERTAPSDSVPRHALATDCVTQRQVCASAPMGGKDLTALATPVPMIALATESATKQQDSAAVSIGGTTTIATHAFASTTALATVIATTAPATATVGGKEPTAPSRCVLTSALETASAIAGSACVTRTIKARTARLLDAKMTATTVGSVRTCPASALLDSAESLAKLLFASTTATTRAPATQALGCVLAVRALRVLTALWSPALASAMEMVSAISRPPHVLAMTSTQESIVPTPLALPTAVVTATASMAAAGAVLCTAEVTALWRTVPKTALAKVCVPLVRRSGTQMRCQDCWSNRSATTCRATVTLGGLAMTALALHVVPSVSAKERLVQKV